MQTADPARRSPITFKCAPAQETVARLRRGFARLGLEPRLEQGRAAPDLDLWWVRVRCAGLGLEAAGKGVSPILAQASALAELAERFSAGLYCRALRFRLPIRRADAASADAAGTDEDADPFRQRYERFRRFDALPGYVAARAADLDAALSLSRLLAPKVVGPAEQQALTSHPSTAHWVDGLTVADHRPVKVPLALVELTSGTNGLAAGNSLDEAIIQGASEVLERYAAVKVITERLRIPTIDPTTLPKIPAIEQFLAYCQAQGIEVLIKDFSLGHGLPCIGMLMIDPRMQDATNPLQTAYAYQRFRVAASPNPIEALTRCITEEGQSRWRVLQTGDANPYHLLWHRLLKHLPTTATAINDHYPLLRSYEYPGDLSFLREGERVDFPSPPQGADCRSEIAALSASCAALGSELIVVDHTHPVLRFPTVRVVVPGVSTILCRLDQQAGLDLERLAAITDDFCVQGRRFYETDDWLDDPTARAELADRLLDHLRQHLSLILHDSGLPRQSINSLELLAPLLLEQGQVAAFAACCRLLADLPGPNGEHYRALAALATTEDQALLQERLQQAPYRRLFRLLAQPQRNPLRATDRASAKAPLQRLIEGFYARST